MSFLPRYIASMQRIVILLTIYSLLTAFYADGDSSSGEGIDANQANHTASTPFIAASNKVAVVFVHGIFGDARDTWKGKDGYFWELLAEQPEFKNVDPYAFGFPSTLWGSGFDVEKASIVLASKLQELRLKYAEIRIIAHSMGGLITVNTFTLYPDLSYSVSMIFAFGAPFEGAGISQMGILLLGNPGISDMLVRNHFLKKTEDQWRLLKDGKRIQTKLYCAYETLPYGLGLFSKIIVPEFSATRLCDGISYPVVGDHLQIVKPSKSRLDSINAVVNAYRQLSPLEKDHVILPKTKESIGTTDIVTPKKSPVPPEKGTPDWPYYEAKMHLTEPAKLTLYDLFLLDFEGTQRWPRKFGQCDKW
jgi:pimeloyl-ACP methyl ester carboxylesterase